MTHGDHLHCTIGEPWVALDIEATAATGVVIDDSPAPAGARHVCEAPEAPITEVMLLHIVPRCQACIVWAEAGAARGDVRGVDEYLSRVKENNP